MLFFGNERRWAFSVQNGSVFCTKESVPELRRLLELMLLQRIAAEFDEGNSMRPLSPINLLDPIALVWSLSKAATEETLQEFITSLGETPVGRGNAVDFQALDDRDMCDHTVYSFFLTQPQPASELFTRYAFLDRMTLSRSLYSLVTVGLLKAVHLLNGASTYA